jgi:DNA-binding XRE family transcriptional regulator
MKTERQFECPRCGHAGRCGYFLATAGYRLQCLCGTNPKKVDLPCRCAFTWIWQEASPGRIRAARASRGLTRVEMAGRCGIGVHELLVLERGDACPLPSLVESFALVTKYTIHFFAKPDNALVEPGTLDTLTWGPCTNPDTLPLCVGCGLPADLVCDARAGQGKCDAPVCAECAEEVRRNRHRCPAHATPKPTNVAAMPRARSKKRTS